MTHALRRLSKIAIWLGIASLLFGLGSCGVGCASTLLGIGASVAGEAEAGETLAGAMVLSSLTGTIFLASGLAAMIFGSVLKAFISEE